MSALEVAVIEDGEILDKQALPVDSYVIVCGERCEITHKAVYANGTQILTIKRIPAPSASTGENQPKDGGL